MPVPRVWALRFGAQLLVRSPADNPVAVAERLLAIQAQDPRGARLAIRARTEGLSAADVDRRLDDGSLVITWLNRGTLHLVRREDYPLLQATTTPQLRTASARRLAQEGVTPDAARRAIAVITRALADEGPLIREALRARVASAGIPGGAQGLLHIMFLAAIEGLVVRGPMRGRQHTYVLAEDWLGKQLPYERSRALPELARRFLRGHGPASDRDLAKWAGLTLRDARGGLSAIGSELRSMPGDLVDLERRIGEAGTPAPRLLGSFDPLLHGWGTRRELLGSYAPVIVTGGMFWPFVLVAGRAAGMWSIAPGGSVAFSQLEPLSGRAARALERDAGDVERFLA